MIQHTMPVFHKLTRVTESEAIYVNLAHVSRMYRETGEGSEPATVLILSEGKLYVRETPEQIAAMKPQS